MERKKGTFFFRNGEIGMNCTDSTRPVQVSPHPPKAGVPASPVDQCWLWLLAVEITGDVRTRRRCSQLM